MSVTFDDWIREQVASEDYWFQRMELAHDFATPGLSDPLRDKLPHFGIPDDMTGMRVLDVGCAEGFFSFEAERRGAAEIVAIDSFPESIRRFNICRSALRSSATPFLCNVYDVNPKTFGTFDLVMFFGVLYHLRHPLLALEQLHGVCTGTLLLQTATYESPGLDDVAIAKFHPTGLEVDSAVGKNWDPTIFWFPNAACASALVQAAGFERIVVHERAHPVVNCVIRAQSSSPGRGAPPDQRKAPWS